LVPEKLAPIGTRRHQIMSTITIRKTLKNGASAWMIDRMEGGKRRRTFHETKAEAESEAMMLRSQVQDYGKVWLSLDAAERNRLMTHWSRIRERGLDPEKLLEAAATATLAKVLPPVSLAEAINSVDRFNIESGFSERYRERFNWVVKAFARGREAMRISAIQSSEISDWLSGRSQWTRATYRFRLSSLFGHAMAQGWLGQNPMDRVPSARMKSAPVAILTVAQHASALRSLLRRPRGLAWYALSCLCGLRPHEAMQMEWQHIRLEDEEPHVLIYSHTSKKDLRRVVYILPTAVAWLHKAKKLDAELPLEEQPLKRVRNALKKAMGLERWIQDITRHTATSYWLAYKPDAPALAELLGHETKTMKRHYRAAVTKDEARRFWAITPETILRPEAIQVDFSSSTSAKEKTQ
jgi:integrase